MTERITGFTVSKPGFLTLVQDSGRRGVMHMGLATGGALDRHAWAWANRLLDNPFGSAALEVTFGGLEFTCNLTTQIAVTGAEVCCLINGLRQPLWTTLNLSEGDYVHLSAPSAGVRCYVAVRGGFQVPLGPGQSSATFIREGTGGLRADGQPLHAGDLLQCPATISQTSIRQIPDSWKPDYLQDLVLDVIPGAQIDRFPATTLQAFFSEPYTLTPQSDRMGARLQGPPLRGAGPTLISEGTSLGAIQVPPDGQPIVLLNDRQTIGGYPKLGAVTPRSLDALAQRHPGATLRFRPVSLYEAQLQERDFLSFFQRHGVA